MAVSEEELAEIGVVLSAPDAAAEAFGALRTRFPHLSWTRCDASDVTETPLTSVGLFDLHLLDGHDHCVTVTSDPQRATGLVLARRRSPA
jgi:hypothetical protein